MILRFALLTPLLLVILSDVASAKTITVSIAVMTNGKPPVGVPAHIYRKTASTSEELITDTDDEGKVAIPETVCSADVQYRVEALLPIRFPQGRLRWESCRITGQIVFLLTPSGISKNTERFLSGQIPDGWVVPQGYEPVFVELREAVASEQWGAAAKLSSQLANQYRSAGRKDEANTFAEIALAGTVSYATSQLPDSDAIDTFLKPKNPDATFDSEIRLSPFAKKAVAEFQKSRGLPTDGIVGWQTMGRLPGGAGYTLPDVAVVPFENLVVKPNT